jgi:DNA-binding NtrC family response regulator
MEAPTISRHPSAEDTSSRSSCPALEVVTGGAADPEPLVHGLRAIRDLVGGTDAVLFTLPPQGVVFHAACGADSARLARDASAVLEDLERRVLGPCVFVPPGRLRGEVDGLDLHELQLADCVILAERAHRGLAFGAAVRVQEGWIPAAPLRFAHSVFRDVARMCGGAEPAPSGRGVAATGWEKHRFGGLVGGSRHMRRLYRTIEKLARSDVNVLLLGESGTGKELVARAIHEMGIFGGHKFVAQNCAALPEALLESELFGHCRGAFTGANLDKRGLFEEANGGTFFLDEIADMPIPLQIKLLRVLQEGEIRRVGETRTRSVSVRVIAATNKRLAEEVGRGKFREDLYYRLDVVKVELAPLRRRKDDVPLLARYFSERICTRVGRPALDFAPEVEQRFLAYDWPGNVRELENEIERLVALHGDEGTVQPFMLSERLRYGAASEFALERLDEMRSLTEAIAYLERAMISRGLERHGWNKSRAATELGISRQGLIKKVHRLQLVRPAPARLAPTLAEGADEDAPPPARLPQRSLPFAVR